VSAAAVAILDGPARAGRTANLLDHGRMAQLSIKRISGKYRVFAGIATLEMPFHGTR
jgi:hypothetical protein